MFGYEEEQQNEIQKLKDEIFELRSEVNRYGNRVYKLLAERQDLMRSNDQLVREVANFRHNCICKHFNKVVP